MWIQYLCDTSSLHQQEIYSENYPATFLAAFDFICLSQFWVPLWIVREFGWIVTLLCDTDQSEVMESGSHIMSYHA